MPAAIRKIFAISALSFVTLLGVSPALGAPYFIDYLGTMDEVTALQPNNVPADFPRQGEGYIVRLVFDNGGDTAVGQTWTREHLSYALIGLNNDLDGALLVVLEKLPGGFTSLTALNSNFGVIETDAAGGLTSVLTNLRLFAYAEDINTDWAQNYGWLPLGLTSALFIEESALPTNAVAGELPSSRVLEVANGFTADFKPFSGFEIAEFNSEIVSATSWSAPASATCQGGVLTTQEDVDGLLSETAFCAHITGDLTLDGAQIYDLSPLRVIRVIDGTLNFGDLSGVEQFFGLSGLELLNGDLPPDADGDGRSDFIDDDDGDGLPYAAELIGGTDPNLADTDGDGVDDYNDEFPTDITRSTLDSDGDGVNDEFDVAPDNPAFQDAGQARFTGVFGNVGLVDDRVFSFPSTAEVWGGFANENVDLYPLTFPHGGQIAFAASVPSGGSADLFFRIERLPYLDTEPGRVEPSYNTEVVTVAGSDTAYYLIEVPSQGDNTFESLLMYLATRDVTVDVADIRIISYPDPVFTDPDGDGVLTVNDAFPDNATEWRDADGGGVGNNAATDADNENGLDDKDLFPLSAYTATYVDADLTTDAMPLGVVPYLRGFGDDPKVRLGAGDTAVAFNPDGTYRAGGPPVETGTWSRLGEGYMIQEYLKP